jgi:hypothetical protein
MTIGIETMDDLILPAQAKGILGCSKPHVIALWRRGQLPGRMVGSGGAKTLLLRRGDVERLAARR